MLIIFQAWVSVFILMLIAWGIFLRTNNPGIVDMFWSIAITTSGLTFIFNTANTVWQWLIAGCLILWGARLAIHLLLTRILINTPEKRYTLLSKKWRLPPTLGFLLHYQFQGILAMIISTPLHLASNLTQYSTGILIGAIISLIGIAGEAVSDYQLNQFRKQHPGDVCDTGLWQYSRHPNYFFDWLTWLGFAIFTMSAPWGYMAFISPALLLFLMLKITGPITEAASINSRGEAYLKYQKKTPLFFPRLPKK